VLVSEAELSDPATFEAVRALVEHPSRIAVHLRARMTAADLFDVARDLSARAWVSGGWCVVNGRPDIALAASAQGVQLGRTALRVSDVRPLLPEHSGVGIGASVHSSAEAARAARQGADYIVVGTIYPTPSHPGESGSGPAGVEAVREAVDEMPVFAIGGIDESRVAELTAAGASGVVVGRAVWGAADPVEAAEGLMEELKRSSGCPT
jgi:thiamine-phosphate diphosphorylase